MTKKELAELQKLQIRSANFGQIFALLKHAITMGAIVWCIKSIFSGLKDIAASSPESVMALSVLAEKMGIETWLGYGCTAAACAGWAIERHGKKRLLKGYSADRKQAEASDAYNSSSGLDETGGTPKTTRRK